MLHSTTKIAKKGRINSECAWGYLFIAPLVLGVYFFSIGPILYSFGASFTNWDGLTKPVFIWLDNYKELFSNKEAIKEITNTLYYTVGTVPLCLILSILLANTLNKKVIGKSMFRTIYFLPSVTMPVAVAMVWRWLFNSDLGLINIFLGVFHLPQPMWLGDPHYIMPAIIIVSIWSQVGYNMIILLAGLQGISTTYYEAADIEGASERVKFSRITLPLLSPTIFFLLTMMLINAFKAFDIIYVFAGGASNFGQGPMLTATRTMVYGIFEKGFMFMKMGYASAEAVLLFLVILVITIIQFVFQGKWVHYE